MKAFHVIFTVSLGTIGCSPLASHTAIRQRTQSQQELPAELQATSLRWQSEVTLADHAEPPSESFQNQTLAGEPDRPSPIHRRDGSLTLEGLEPIALQNNPSLAIARARVDAARGHWIQAGLYPNPVIGYHATEIGNRGTAGQQGGFISQRIVTPGKRRLDRDVVCREILEAQFLLDAQKQRVLSDVRIRFHDALVSQRRVELTRQLVRIADDLVAASTSLLEGRQVSENDLLLAEIEAEQAHILLDNARNENVEAWRRLAAVIGEPTMPIAPLAGNLDPDLPRYQWDDCYAMVLCQSPELDAARTRIERARLAYERADLEKVPNIDVSVSVRHHNVTSDDVTNVQLGVPLPIFNANQGNVYKAQADWRAARADILRISLDLQDRLAVAYRRYENARKQVERYNDRILVRAKQSLDLMTGAYANGQVGYLTLITSQQTFVRVNLAYLDSVRELRDSLAVIEGRLLIGSLKSPGPSVQFENM